MSGNNRRWKGDHSQLICYNCGEKGHLSRNCKNQEQQFTRCPTRSCRAVAFSKAGHRISCGTPKFVSQQIGAYELPWQEFHNIRFVFRITKNVYSAEQTTRGPIDFVITKFLSLGTNIQFSRVYDGSANVVLNMKIKPSVTIGFGRKNESTHLASAMFCEDHVRLNHFYHIDRLGTVSYQMTSKPRTDESHDVELKIDSTGRVILFTVEWNNEWSANIAMSDKAVTVGPYIID